MARPRTNTDGTRRQLLDTAGAMVTDDGLAALSLRRLAARAQTSTTAVYSLFGSRHELVAALYAEGFARLAQRLDAAPTTDDAYEDLIGLGLAYRESAVADPHYYRVMFTDQVDPRSFDGGVADGAAQTFRTLVSAVERCRAAGLMDADPQLVATALWANVHGLVSIELGGYLPPDAIDPAVLFETAVRRATSGWLARKVDD